MDSFARVVDTCARSLSRYEMAAAEGPVTVAVSGGVDSTVLLLAMVRLQAEGRLSGPLVAAHVDHSVRPDSRENAQHVVEMCDRLDVPLTVRRLPRNGARQEGSSEAVVASGTEVWIAV